MNWIDSHCHLEGFLNKGTLPEILERSREAGVSHLVAIGTDPEDWKVNHDLVTQFPSEIHYTVGLHPNHVDSSWEHHTVSLQAFFALAPKPVAVGEIGLDYFRLPKEEAKAASLKVNQRAAFRYQLALAKELGLPVVVHCRGAFADCVAEIDDSGVEWSKVVFHCFADGPNEMRQLMERGGRGSFTGIVTFGNAENVREAALLQGLEKLMLETDSPYLAPVPFRGKSNEPSFLPYIGEYLAKAFEVEEAALAAITTRNTLDFYCLSSS
ncbi:MAG: TatD family hydrolase [Opitutales bacterium]|nr:TatD family hydrolase [Opitutales bacterium]